MRIKLVLSMLSTPVAAALFLSGCSKPADSTAPAVTQRAPAESAAPVEGAPKTAAVAEVKTTSESTVEAAAKVSPPTVPTTEVAAPAVPTQSLVQSTFTKAKGLIAEKKYPEALAALSELSNVNLTAEQQTLVEQLKAQIQTLMASQAGNEGVSAVGRFLKKQ
jgi:outer membrane PBP1 activator LpoA protein